SIGSGARLVPFDTSGSVFDPLTTRAADPQLILYDPAGPSVTRMAATGFAPAVFQAGAALPGGGIAVAGGIDWMGMPLAMTIPQVKQAIVAHALAGAMPPFETPRTGTTA